MSESASSNGRSRTPIEMKWGDSHEQVRQEMFYEIGASVAMRKPFWQMTRLRHNMNVLLEGETGTGKTYAAHVIHKLVYGAEARPFVQANLSALPEQLVGSELFGHERGAFTGADRRRIGRMEEANGGAILIDEIGVVPGVNQVQMLTALDDPRSFQRIGGNENISPEILVICATTSDLLAMVQKKEFDAALYERLRERVIHMPSLLERGPDFILQAVPTLLSKVAASRSKKEQQDVATLEIDDAVLEEFAARPYPGNLRDLNFLVRDVAQEAYEQGASRITLEHFDIAVATKDNGATPSKPTSLKEIQKQAILDTLERFQGDRQKTADVLGISTATIANRLKEWGLVTPRKRRVTDETKEQSFQEPGNDVPITETP